MSILVAPHVRTLRAIRHHDVEDETTRDRRGEKGLHHRQSPDMVKRSNTINLGGRGPGEAQQVHRGINASARSDAELLRGRLSLELLLALPCQCSANERRRKTNKNTASWQTLALAPCSWLTPALEATARHVQIARHKLPEMFAFASSLATSCKDCIAALSSRRRLGPFVPRARRSLGTDAESALQIRDEGPAIESDTLEPGGVQGLLGASGKGDTSLGGRFVADPRSRHHPWQAWRNATLSHSG